MSKTLNQERCASRKAAKQLKKILIQERGNKCEKCGCKHDIQYHHKNHDRRINTRENAILLCDRCHKHAHYIDKRITDYSRPPTSYIRM